MTPDPLVAPAVVQPVINQSPDGATRPAPTIQEEQTADNVFGPEASNLAAALLTAQTGLALMNHIALEVAPAKEEESEQLPRKKQQPEADA
jgi:formaldehyde-activating enzyme involved in methanogenesis